METLFTNLTHAIESSAFIALSAAMIWGVFSVLLSPCHLAGIPMIVGLVDEQNAASPRKAFIPSLFFAIGILLSIVLIGLITTLAGRILGDIGRYGNYIAALIFFVMGLQLLGILSSPWKQPKQNSLNSKNFWLTFCAGLLFGIALGPCTFAFMAPILAVTFKLSAEAPGYAVTLLLMYGIGHCLVIVLAGMSAGIIRRWLAWHNEAKGALHLRKLCGILILLAGLYLIYTA
jgi:cytochrome c-type biogenesis protein